MWVQVLLPMGQRVARAVPTLVKATLVLVAFCLLAIALGVLTRRLLGMTDEVGSRASEGRMAWRVPLA